MSSPHCQMGMLMCTLKVLVYMRNDASYTHVWTGEGREGCTGTAAQRAAGMHRQAAGAADRGPRNAGGFNRSPCPGELPTSVLLPRLHSAGCMCSGMSHLHMDLNGSEY
jgi:hypothetical protein